MKRSRLTTEDNPHDPFDEYPAWHAYDTRLGYNTPAFLARVLVTSHEMSEADQELANEQAIDEIIHYNVLGIYKKVSKDIP